MNITVLFHAISLIKFWLIADLIQNKHKSLFNNIKFYNSMQNNEKY